MYRRRNTHTIGEILISGLSILFLAIYFFLVVPDYFNGVLDFFFLCLTYFVLYWTSRYMVSPYIYKQYRFDIINFTIAFLLLYLLILVVVIGASWLWGGLEWSDDEWDMVNFWHVFVIFFLPSIVGLFMYIWKVGIIDGKLLQQSMLRYQMLKKDLALLQVQMIQQEISPHFLNNTLAIIQPLIRIEPLSAIKVIENCNQILRYYMLQHGKKLITCQEELDQVERVREIYELRKGMLIPIQMMYDPAVLPAIDIPPMMLINLVENAFQYGDLNRSDAPVVIKLQLKAQSIVMIEVSNALPPKAKISSGTGTSQQRTKDLLKLLDPESGNMEIRISSNTYLVHITFDMKQVRF